MRILLPICLLLPILIFFTIDQPASAGFLDSLVDKTKKSVQKAIEAPIDEQVDQVFKTGKGETSPDPAEGSGGPASQAEPDKAPSTSTGSKKKPDDNWKKTSTYSDDAAQAMTFFEAPPGSPSVLDVPLKNIRLGMPLRIAHERLTRQGFEYLSHKAYYHKEVRNVNGEIRAYSEEEQRQLSRSGQGKGKLLERYIVKLHTNAVSEEMMAELDAERQAWATEAHQMKSREPGVKQASTNGRRSYDSSQDRTSRRQSIQLQSERGKAPYFTGQPVSLIAYIEYRQYYFGDQRFDYDAAKAQAEQTFGPQNYTNRSSASRRGAAYKTSPEYQLVYADVLLVPAAEREALVQQGNPNAHYGMKLAMSHPCSGFMRSACVNGAPAGSAFPGNLEKQLQYARLKFAPFMIVNHDSNGMKIIQEWQYLLGGDTIRENFAKKQERAAQPVAAPSF